MNGTSTVLFFTAGTALGSSQRLSGVSRYAASRGWMVQTIARVGRETRFAEILDAWRPVGVLLEYGDDLSRDALRRCGRLPTVCLDRNPAWGGVCVCQDSHRVGEMAARELLAGGDRRSFGYVGFTERKFWDDERRAGYAETLARFGCACEAFSPRGVAPRDFSRRLGDWLAALPHPCAVMASNDNVAVRVLGVAAQRGLAVPDDVAVVGVDNAVHVCEGAVPTLSSVEPDFEASGYLAAQVLDGLLAGDSASDRTVRYAPVRVVRRASSSVLRRVDPSVARALEFIRTHVASGLRATDVISVLGGSRRAAEMRFRATVGRGIFETIDAMRLELAQTMLRRPDLKVGAVAGLCGYGTEANFFRAFRRATGQTPAAWRCGAMKVEPRRSCASL